MMDTAVDISGYIYENGEKNASHDYLVPAVLEILGSLHPRPENAQLFELGCGNGAVAHTLAQRGYRIVGVDPSEQGIAQAKMRYPHLDLHRDSAYDDLAGKYGRFSVVLSLEVVEHLYAPRAFARTLFDLIEPGGTAIVSTPYHGYLKNLALALSGQLDRHFTALWDHGHIKFWSIPTLTRLLQEAGFGSITFRRIGRIPTLAKSMIAVARKV
jgi:2-polyprenyl-6-hydroxyphenyl methylase/3-demethylubiquinone-9 3-methyltransferase